MSKKKGSVILPVYFISLDEYYYNNKAEKMFDCFPGTSLYQCSNMFMRTISSTPSSADHRSLSQYFPIQASDEKMYEDSCYSPPSTGSILPHIFSPPTQESLSSPGSGSTSSSTTAASSTAPPTALHLHSTPPFAKTKKPSAPIVMNPYTKETHKAPESAVMVTKKQRAPHTLPKFTSVAATSAAASTSSLFLAKKQKTPDGKF